MATIDQYGVTLTTLAEYLDQLQQAHLDIDPAWNINPETPDGLRIAVESELLANLDEQVEAAYRSIDPNSAIGQQLNRIAFISGLTRQAATASTATVVFSGVNGTAIPVGTKVRNTVTDTLWSTDSVVTISGGTASATVTCDTLGAQVAAIGNLSSIYTPVGGVSSVTNLEAASIGRDEESDTIFRVRRNLSVAKPGNNQADSMFAAIANVVGVKKVKIYENDEAAADANGVDPHSIAIFVDGGLADDVAAAIASEKCPGSGLNASNTYPNKEQIATTTPGGSSITVTFFRPDLTTVYVAIVVAGDIKPADHLPIKQAVVDFANATLFDTDGTGFDRTGFDIGDIISAGKLFTPVNKVIGDKGYPVSVQIGTSPGDITLNTIDPGFNGLGVFSTDNVTVTVV